MAVKERKGDKFQPASAIQKANEVDLIDFIDKQGIAYKNQGKYIRLEEHSSFVINKDGQFYWNKQNTGGRGAVSFSMLYYDIPFLEAVSLVNENEYARAEPRVIEPKKFEYDPKTELDNIRQVEKYFTTQRMLQPGLATALHQKNLLAQNDKGGAVFKWYQQGNFVGAEIQGTSKIVPGKRSFKHIYPSETEYWGYYVDIGNPNKLAVFEDKMDGHAYANLHPEKVENCRLFSMNGFSAKAIYNMVYTMSKEGHSCDKIILGLDNDEAGLSYIEQAKTVINEDMLEVDIPPKAEGIEKMDWSAELINRRKAGIEIPNLDLNKIQDPLRGSVKQVVNNIVSLEVERDKNVEQPVEQLKQKQGSQEENLQMVSERDTQTNTEVSQNQSKVDPNLASLADMQPPEDYHVAEELTNRNESASKQQFLDELNQAHIEKVKESKVVGGFKANLFEQNQKTVVSKQTSKKSTEKPRTAPNTELPTNHIKSKKISELEREYVDLIKWNVVHSFSSSQTTVSALPELARAKEIEREDNNKRMKELEVFYGPEKIYQLKKIAVQEMKMMKLNEPLKEAVERYEKRIDMEMQLRPKQVKDKGRNR
ncbi:toprim domain-containing protein [Listeria booriae]|uniref:DUF3991 domain-containing protein n=1 Tax=Listeria booriae TaxID=1552123 RepID=A0A7X0ZYS2_9LIST|nr:toprim domain-containing protein [Listeria booriae]MBC2312067.1 DUF3991 domain-containing protein [Listeria booriae]